MVQNFLKPATSTSTPCSTRNPQPQLEPQLGCFNRTPLQLAASNKQASKQHPLKQTQARVSGTRTHEKSFLKNGFFILHTRFSRRRGSG
jgi:hypothetical protein